MYYLESKDRLPCYLVKIESDLTDTVTTNIENAKLFPVRSQAEQFLKFNNRTAQYKIKKLYLTAGE